MRIFTAIRHSNDPAFYYGGLWSGNFYPALRQLGHEIVESQTDLLPASIFMHVAGGFTQQELQARSLITEKIVDEVRRSHKEQRIDLFLSYFYNSHFDPEGFGEIHRLGIPTVNFYCNSIYQFDLVAQIAARCNYAWHTEKEARASYLKVGANPVWVQMGADPEVYYPLEQITREPRACFVGQRYADRDRHLAALINQNIPLDIYGSGWKQADTGNGKHELPFEIKEEYLGRKLEKPGGLKSYAQATLQNFGRHGVLDGTVRTINQARYRVQRRSIDPLLASAARGVAGNLSETFARYEVVLNFSNVWADGRPGSRLIPHVRLRDFEAPMCRACYLTGYSDEILEFYEPRKEIDLYTSTEELIEKTKYYLDNPAQAENLRAAGFERARRDHTWNRRFEQLFREIKLAPANRSV
jgi:glycosyltransferase involved in cell wall biosynthesis